MAKLWTHLLFSVPVISIQSLQDLGTWGLLLTEHVPHCCLWVSQTVYRYWYVLKLKTFCEVKRADFSLKAVCVYVHIVCKAWESWLLYGVPLLLEDSHESFTREVKTESKTTMAADPAWKAWPGMMLVRWGIAGWIQRRGPRIIYNQHAGVTKAFRNIPGVLFKCSNSLLLGKWYQDI